MNKKQLRLLGIQGATSIKLVTAATAKMVTTDLAAVLVKTSLTPEIQKQILMDRGLSESEAEAALATAAHSEANITATISTNALGSATGSLIYALKGLWATFLDNPLLMIIASLGALALAFNKLSSAAVDADVSNRLKEETEKALEKIKTLEQEKKQISDLISEYEELKKSEKDDPETRSKISSIQKEINKLVGDHAEGLDLVNGKLDDELKKLKQIKYQESNNNIRDYKTAYSVASNSAKNAYIRDDSDIKYLKFMANWDGQDIYAEGYDEDIADILKNVKGVSNVQKDWLPITGTITDISFDARSAEEYYEILGKCIDALEEDSRYYSKNDNILTHLVDLRNGYKAFIDNKNEAGYQLLDNLIAIKEYESNIDWNSIETVEDYNTYKHNLVKSIIQDDSIKEAVADGLFNWDNIGSAVENQLGIDYPELISRIQNNLQKNNIITQLMQPLINAPADVQQETRKNIEDFLDNLSEDDFKIACKVIPDSFSLEELKEAIKDYIPENTISFSDLISDDSDGSFIKTVDAYISAVDKLQTARTNFKNNKFDNKDFVELVKQFPSLATRADDLDVAIEELLGTMDTDITSKFSSQFNKLSTDEDREQLSAFMDSVLELGKVVGSTEFSIDIGTEISDMDNFFKSIKESISSTGLTAESISNIKRRFEGLDMSGLFERTYNGIHLNTTALRRLENEYEKAKKISLQSDLDNLTQKYNNLTIEINKEADAEERANLYTQREKILQQINDTADLAAQYEGLTSAFHKWEEAQSVGEEGDMYDSLANGLENIKELHEKGLIGTNKFRAAVQLMSNEDLSNATIKELLEIYDSGYKKMTRYFTDGSDGCLNFLNDLQKVNSEWVSMNKDGSWNINFGLGNDEEIAKALGINVESVQAIMRKLSDYGFDINLDSALSDFDLLKSRAEEANEKLIKLGKTNIIFQFETDDLQLVEAQELLDTFKDSEGKVDITIEGAEEAQEILTTLITKKQLLAAPDIMVIDTSKISEIDNELSNAISILQQYIKLLNDLEIQKRLGLDTSDTQKEIQKVVGQIQNISPDIKAKIGLDDETLDVLMQSIQDTEVNVEAGINIDEDNIEYIRSLIGNIKAKDIEMLTNSSVIIDELEAVDTYTIDDKYFSVSIENYPIIELNNINSYVFDKKYIDIFPRLNGLGHSQGTAFSNGSWGTKSSGIALGGEVGQELVVRNGRFFTIGDDSAELFRYQKDDIIFNAEQTRQILENGKITNGKKRGVTYATGTAFSSGTGAGTIYANGSVKTKASNNSSDKDSSDKEKEPQTIDWIEIAIDRIERAIKKLKSTAESTYKALSKRLTATNDEISKVNQEISLHEKAYERYIKKANSIGLSSDLKKKVQDGTIDISEYDETTAKLIKDYQNWYEKAIKCSDAIQELHENLASLYKDIFDNTQKDYDNKLGLLKHLTNSYNTGLEKLEAKGYLASTKYYSSLQKVEKDNISIMKEELSDLESSLEQALASREIEKYSEEWYEMQGAIDDVKDSIDEAELSLLKYDKTMRELDWSYFDYVQDRINQITQETNFLIDTMSDSSLYDDKGQLNDKGNATLGLRTENYNVYMAQADKYAKEINKIDKEIKKDPYNTDLIKRREDLLKLQQDSIKAANGEKQAIVELVRGGINIELNSLKELINSYAESLDNAKDLYEYQKKIESKTKNIASLEKRLSAYQGDTSEETRATIQKLKIDLETAREDLDETEYDKYVTDTKKLLDNLYNDYESILNERLDNVDFLLSDMINKVNQGSADICTTLTDISSSIGYTITDANKNIWDNGGSAHSVVTTYGTNFNNQLTSVNTTLDGITTNVSDMVKNSTEEAKKSTSSNSTALSKPSSSSNSKVSTSNNQSSSSSSSTKSNTFNDDIMRGIAAAIWIYGDASGWGNNPDRKNKLTAKFGSANAAKIQSYINAHGTNGDLYKYWVSNGKGKLTEYYYKAFKNGGIADFTGLAQLDGSKQKPEAVLDAEDTQNFIELRDLLRNKAQNSLYFDSPHNISNVGLSGLLDISDMLTSIKGSNSVAGTTIGDINISIPIEHVDDYNDLVSKLQRDDRFEKMILSMTVDNISGRSSLSKYKYNWK